MALPPGRTPVNPPPRRLVTFALDGVLFASASALQIVPFTGGLVHEWLGIAFAAMMVWHLLLSWSWISTHSRRVFSPKSIRSGVNYLLNWCLFATIVVLILSGILISQDAIPAVTGIRTVVRADSVWEYVHGHFSDFAVILIGLHLAVNWDWSVAAVRKLTRHFKVKAGAV